MTTNNKTNTEKIAECIGRAVAPYANKLKHWYHNDEKYAKNVPYTDIETEAKAIARLFEVSTNTERTVDEVALKEFYSTEGIPDEMKQAISFMRQWLNEDRKATPMVTARDLWHWISPIILAERQRTEGEKQSIIKEILEVIPETVPYLTGDQDNMKKAVKAIATRNDIAIE